MSEDTTKQDGAEGTEQLTEIPSSEDVPKNIVSELMDVTPEVLEQHYDARDKEELLRHLDTQNRYRKPVVYLL